MGIYSKIVFRRICDLLLNKPFVNEHRRSLLAQASGNLLEIGFGTGLNLPHYPETIRKITTVDPNAGMHSLALKRIKQTGIEVDHRQVSGEKLPFEDSTFDCAVSTFTLCSIANVQGAISETYRVLKPGGLFLFFEHGLCPEPGVQKWQRRLNWLERVLADGCHLDRNISEVVTAQPFSSAQISNLYLEQTPKTHGYIYRGMATK